MSKQTLQQKIQRALARFTPRRIAIIMLGTAILSFGIHNIHQRTAITEGGIIGLGAAHQPLARRSGIGGVAPVGCHKLRAGV